MPEAASGCNAPPPYAARSGIGIGANCVLVLLLTVKWMGRCGVFERKEDDGRDCRLWPLLTWQPRKDELGNGSPTPSRRRRRWRIIALIVFMAGAALVAGLPWVLELAARTSADQGTGRRDPGARLGGFFIPSPVLVPTDQD